MRVLNVLSWLSFFAAIWYRTLFPYAIYTSAILPIIVVSLVFGCMSSLYLAGGELNNAKK
jgi:hypothetical protein